MYIANGATVKTTRDLAGELYHIPSGTFGTVTDVYCRPEIPKDGSHCGFG